jgi:putative polyhydroxyalkanoate system protein
MAQINIIRSHKLQSDDLKLKIDQLMTELASDLEFRSEWESSTEFSFRRRGANGSITLSENQLELTLNLGIMYRALKNSIERKILEVLGKYLS